MRYYKFTAWGYGAEHYICKITKEQFDFWTDIKERASNYEVEDEKAEAIWESIYWDHNDRTDIPEEAKFGMESVRDWGEYVYSGWGAFLGSGHLSVVEVDSTAYNANEISAEIKYELSEDLDQIEEQLSEIEWGPDDETYPSQIEGKILYWVSSEKGVFFEGIIGVEGEYDPKKVQLVIEDIDGNYILRGIKYDGEDVDNNGGDTRGKGEDFYFIDNEV